MKGNISIKPEKDVGLTKSFDEVDIRRVTTHQLERFDNSTIRS